MTDENKPDVPRNADGTFQENNNANPDGNNGHVTGWQRQHTRLPRFLNKKGSELKSAVESPTFMEDNSVIDIGCMLLAKDIIIGDPETRLKALREVTDRCEGKATQSVKHGGDPDNKTPINMDGSFTLTFGTEDNNGGDGT